MGILVGILVFLVVCLSVFSIIQCKRVARLEEENCDLCAEIEELDDENDSLFSSVECAKKSLENVENSYDFLFNSMRSVTEFLKDDDVKYNNNRVFFVLDGSLHKVIDYDYKIGENGKIIVNSIVLEPFAKELADSTYYGLHMAASSIDETVKREKARVLEEEIQGKQKELEKLKK